jgi:hypothetical protein
MGDKPTIVQTEIRQPDMTADTISGVMTDLALLSSELPVGADRIEEVAGMLDQLSVELREAAQTLRDTGE